MCLAGVAGYTAAGWSVVDAAYMVTITVFGVGYGEVRPVVTPALRGFTMAVIIGGYAATIYAVGGFLQMITEGEINRALGARRMTREIRHLKGHTILCGFGRMGRILARELAAAKREFIVVDRDHEKIREAAEHGYLVLAGDASDEEILLARRARRGGGTRPRRGPAAAQDALRAQEDGCVVPRRRTRNVLTGERRVSARRRCGTPGAAPRRPRSPRHSRPDPAARRSA